MKLTFTRQPRPLPEASDRLRPRPPEHLLPVVLHLLEQGLLLRLLVLLFSQLLKLLWEKTAPC